MDKKIAERLITSALALDRSLGEIDAAISQIPDESERKALARRLGHIVGDVYVYFIRPVELEYPDLAENN